MEELLIYLYELCFGNLYGVQSMPIPLLAVGAAIKGIGAIVGGIFGSSRARRAARKAAAETILSELDSSDREITITFFDCSSDDKYSTMEHDRYVKYSQNRALISSGGFRNVYSDIDEETDLGELKLNPKTFLIKIMLDVDTNVEGPHRHLVIKKLI